MSSVTTVYFLLDCSKSMAGGSIESIHKTMDELLNDWKYEPLVLEACLSVIAFNDVAKQIVPPTDFFNFTIPKVDTGGEKNLGGALYALKKSIDNDLKKDKHNYSMVILFTDGNPPADIDVFNKAKEEILSLPIFTFIACTANKSEYLNELTQYVIPRYSADDINSIIFHVYVWYDEGDLIEVEEADWRYRRALQKSTPEQVYNDQTAINIVADKVDLYKKGESAMSNLIRRLPVYLLVDCSGSMSGEPIEAVRQGIDTLISDLSSEPQALETAYLSVITFDSTAQQVVPLTDLMSFTMPSISAGGTTALGEALQVLRECINREVRKSSAEQKGDWKPLVFILTDGYATDTDVFDQEVLNVPNLKTAAIIACAAGPAADTSCLKRITDNVLIMNYITPGSMAQFFAWVSGSIVGASKSLDVKPGAPINLAPPPTGFIVVP